MAEVDVKWMPVSAAAKRLGCSKSRVYQLIKLRKLGSLEMESTVLVSSRSVEDRVRLQGGLFPDA